MLLCTVRACHLPLGRDGRRMVCANAHSFDVARSGYINLLQPQDRRSRKPGDTNEAVAARRRLHDRGVTAPLAEAISEITGIAAGDVVLDAGCGEGFYLGTLAGRSGAKARGVDISTQAIDLAARRYGSAEWIVANADRFVPYRDGSFSLVLSITGRMNAPEFRRVLCEDGRLLVAVAAPEDLMELRGAGKDRVERTVGTFAEHFKLIDRGRAVAAADLDAEGVQDVLVSIYRPLRSEPVTAMRVTFSLDLLLFSKR